MIGRGLSIASALSSGAHIYKRYKMQPKIAPIKERIQSGDDIPEIIRDKITIFAKDISKLYTGGLDMLTKETEAFSHVLGDLLYHNYEEQKKVQTDKAKEHISAALQTPAFIKALDGCCSDSEINTTWTTTSNEVNISGKIAGIAEIDSYEQEGIFGAKANDYTVEERQQTVGAHVEAGEDIIVKDTLTSPLKKIGRWLSEDETIPFIPTIESTGDDNCNPQPKALKMGDDVAKGFKFNIDDPDPDPDPAKPKYLLLIEPTEDPVKKMLEKQKKTPKKWKTKEVLSAVSLAAVIATAAFYFPMSLTLPQVTAGLKIASAFSSCVIEAVDMINHLDHSTKLDNCYMGSIDAPEKLARVNDAKNPHYFLDFKGTLSKEKFQHIKSSDKNTLTDVKLKDILQKAVALGEQGNKIHPIHKSLKEKLQSLDENDDNNKNSFEKDKVKQSKDAEVRGYYYDDNAKPMAIGNSKLIKKAIEETVDDKTKKATLLEKLADIENTADQNYNATYILSDNEIFMLETESVLRDDAKDLLENNKGHFTILTGGKIPQSIKEQYQLNSTNCFEELSPEGKLEKSKEIIKSDETIQDNIKIFMGDNDNDSLAAASGQFDLSVRIMEDINDLDDEDTRKQVSQAIFDVTMPDTSKLPGLSKSAKEILTHKNKALMLGAVAYSYMSGYIVDGMIGAINLNPLIASGLGTAYHLLSPLGFNQFAQHVNEKIYNKNMHNKPTDDFMSNAMKGFAALTLGTTAIVTLMANYHARVSLANSIINVLTQCVAIAPLIPITQLISKAFERTCDPEKNQS